MVWPFRPARSNQREKRRDDMPMLRLTEFDSITLSQCFESVMICGGTGSGKTTSVGAHLCFNLLRAGCGMVVFTVKHDEYARIKAMCDELGRECLRMAPGEPHRLDVLDYSLRHKHGSIEETCALLDQLLEVVDRNKGVTGSNEPFWGLLAKRILKMCITLVWLGQGKCSIADLYTAITSLPTKPEQLKSEEWLKSSLIGRCAVEGDMREMSPEQSRQFVLACEFVDEWVNLSEKTRSIGYTMVINILSQFMGGDVSTLIASGETTLTPEDVIANNRVIVIDYPILRHREPAQFMQIVLKTLFQRAVLRREIRKWTAPFVLWIDEANWTVMPQADALTLSVSRASKLITVALFQNLPLLYRSFGSGESARDDALAWLGNFSTKIACANSCNVTNEYWQALCGSSRHMYFSGSTSVGEYDAVSDMLFGTLPKTSGGFAEQWHPDVPAGHYAQLRKGGKSNQFLVDVIAYQNGRLWSNGRVYLPATVKQRLSIQHPA